MSKNYIVDSNAKENLHVHDTTLGTVNTTIATEKVSEVFPYVSVV
jgi:hypothetical protein